MPDHSTFSKNRHGRFRDSDTLRFVFEQVLERCVREGLVGGKGFAIDASLVKADANRQRGVPGAEADWPDPKSITRPVREYLAALDQPEVEKNTPKNISLTDPAAQWSAAWGPAFYAYSANYLIDIVAGIVVDVEATPAHKTDEINAAKTMIERVEARFEPKPDRLIGDTNYGTAEILGWMVEEKQIEPHVPVWDKTQRDDESCPAATSSGTKRPTSRKYSTMGILQRWYERIDTDDLVATLRHRKWKKFLQAQVYKAMSRTVLEDDFPKLVTTEGGEARIKDNPPLIFHQTELDARKYDRFIKASFRRYRSTSPDDRKALLDHYELKDVAAKVVGVGSVGTLYGILLMMAGRNDPIFLQVKEARASVLEPYAGRSRYANHGQRVVEGQRLMQAASDIFLGWTEDRGRHFYIRQLRDVKIKPLVEVADFARLARYAIRCGWALARAHAKSGDAAMISGYLGKSTEFDDAVLRFAMAYADQNRRDHQALLKAVRARRIEVFQE